MRAPRVYKDVKKKKTKTTNQTQYMSGSKKSFGINMQATCDSNVKFGIVSAKHVGSTNDAEAFETSKLKETNESLPFPYHWNGDPAYVLTETMMIPFPGVNLHIVTPSKEWFNFWHSQVRITIERCFGIFIARWGIFWVDLKYDIDTIFEIIHACCRLHNFCIDHSVPVLSNTYIPPEHARLDDNGVLLDPVWRNVDPAEVMHVERSRTGNTLRESILNTVTINNYESIRSHHR